MQNLKFDKTLLKDFWQICKPFWFSTEKYYAFSLLVINILCVIVEVRARVSINNFSKDFYDALQAFNQTALLTSLWHFIIVLGVLALAFGYSIYFTGLLSIRWRQWLTKNYLYSWLKDQTYYHMQLSNPTLDNPDQRISEDLQKFTEMTLNLFFMIIYSLMIVFVFGLILWNFSAYLLGCALIYALLGSIVMAWIGKKLANLNYQQQHYNADFRFSLVKLRESSEQVALHRGEQAENKHFENLFTRIYKNFTFLVKTKRNLNFFNNGYNTASFVFGLFVAIPLYLQKKILLGGLMQISGAFSYVIGSFSVFVNSFETFAEWRSVIHRLTEFNQATAAKINTQVAISTHHQEDIIIDSLHVHLPCGKAVFENKQFLFQKGEKYLLQGPSGSGKTLLLRTLAGLWPHAQGNITFPKLAKIIFLPQKPYIPSGTLLDIICYPEKMTKKNLKKILQICQLEKFAEQLLEQKNWAKELSLGEQQLIAFARIFLANPDILFLDEATSAMDEATQHNLYEALIQTFPHLTLISVGHRQTLQAFHTASISL